MNRSRITLTLMAVGLTAFEDGRSTQQILQVARATWPGSHSVGIVCNYARSGETIRAMLDAFAPGSTVTVLDVRSRASIYTACVSLTGYSPQFVLLLPDDPIVHDGSWEARQVIFHMNYRKIPPLATTPTALAQGAWAVMGPATGNQLQVNPALQGYIEAYGTPMYPNHPSAKNTGAGTRTTLSVIAAF